MQRRPRHNMQPEDSKTVPGLDQRSLSNSTGIRLEKYRQATETVPVWFQTTAIKKIFDEGSHRVFWFPSAGEGTGYPLQCSSASLVAQMAKNLPAMWETWVRSLSWEDLLEKRRATHSSILAWRIPWTVWAMGLQRIRQE